MAIWESLILNHLDVPLIDRWNLPSAIVPNFSSWFRFGHVSTICEETLLDIHRVVLGLFNITVIDKLIHLQQMTLLVKQSISGFVSSISLLAWHSTVSLL